MHRRDGGRLSCTKSTSLDEHCESNGACLSEHPHAFASAHSVGNRLRRSLARVFDPHGDTGRRTKPPSGPSFRSPHEDADAGIRTRVTAATGPYDSRPTPRRHARQLPREHRTRELGVQRPASFRQRGLRGYTQPQLRVRGTDVPATLSTLSAYGVARSHRCRVRTEIRTPRASPSWPARERDTELFG
jgi:hypothetical protein